MLTLHIVNHHYMNDYVNSFDTWEEGERIAEEVYEINEKGDFHMRNFV